MKDWTLSPDPARLQLDLIHAWLSGAYWSAGVRRDIVEHAFAHSIAVGAYGPDGEQVGVARAVSDQATFAWLCDVFVAPGWRQRGIAGALVAALLADPRLQTVRRWCLATRDAHQAYRPFGFAPVDANLWMEWRPDPARWR